MQCLYFQSVLFVVPVTRDLRQFQLVVELVDFFLKIHVVRSQTKELTALLLEFCFAVLQLCLCKLIGGLQLICGKEQFVNAFRFNAELLLDLFVHLRAMVVGGR